MEKVYESGGVGDWEPPEDEVKYRLTTDGEDVARRIPFRYSLYMDV